MVQETWIHALTSLATFRWESELRTWLTGIAVNTSRTRLRRRVRLREVEPDDATEAVVDEPVSPADRLALERALGELPSGFREVLVLHDVEGFTHEEIGAILGVSAGTSRSQLFHARRALWARLMRRPMENRA